MPIRFEDDLRMDVTPNHEAERVKPEGTEEKIQGEHLKLQHRTEVRLEELREYYATQLHSQPMEAEPHKPGHSAGQRLPEGHESTNEELKNTGS